METLGTMRIAGSVTCAAGTEASGGDSQCGHVFLRLEQDDVDFWSEEASEHHRAAQADGDAHGGRLNLQKHKGRKQGGTKQTGQSSAAARHAPLELGNKYACRSRISLFLESLARRHFLSP